MSSKVERAIPRPAPPSTLEVVPAHVADSAAPEADVIRQMAEAWRLGAAHSRPSSGSRCIRSLWPKASRPCGSCTKRSASARSWAKKWTPSSSTAAFRSGSRNSKCCSTATGWSKAKPIFPVCRPRASNSANSSCFRNSARRGGQSVSGQAARPVRSAAGRQTLATQRR